MADSIYERLGITGAVELIRRYLPEFAKQLEITDKWWSLRLPVALEADYTFVLYGYPDGSRQIRAVLVHQPEDGRSFWYTRFERSSFGSDLTKLHDCFNQVVEKILRYQTRIIEKRGVVWLTYCCDYQNGTAWKRLGPEVSTRRLRFGMPFIGMKRIYRSPAVGGLVRTSITK